MSDVREYVAPRSLLAAMRLREEGNEPVCPRGGDHDRQRHQHARHGAVGRIARRIELPYCMGGVGAQQDAERQHRHGQPAPPAEHIAKAEQGRAGVVALGQLGAQRGRGDLVEGDQAAHQDRHGQQVEEQLILAEPCGRSPEKVKGDGGGNGGEVHEGVTPTPAARPVVADHADDGIEHGIDRQRDHDGEAHQA